MQFEIYLIYKFINEGYYLRLLMKLYIFFIFVSILPERFDARIYPFRSPQDNSFAQQVYTNNYVFDWMFYDQLLPFAVLPLRQNSILDEFIDINYKNLIKRKQFKKYFRHLSDHIDIEK